MLKKLLKYDLMRCMKIFPVIAAGILAVFALGMAAKALKVDQLMVTSILVLALLAVGSVVAALVIIVVRFYSGLFSREGYLYQSLPVGTGKLISSKMITALICYATGIILSFASIYCLAMVAGIDAEIWSGFKELIGMSDVFGPLIAYGIVSVVIASVAMLSEIFFVITLSHTRPFIRYNILFSIVGYFIINTVVGFIEMFFMMLFPLGLQMTGDKLGWTTKTMAGFMFNPYLAASEETIFEGTVLGVGNWVADILVIVTLLILTQWIMKKKASVK